jgi:hypothetical protein
LAPTEKFLPEDGDRIPSPKRCVLKNTQDGVLDKDKTMDNVQKHNICTNVLLSQTFRSYLPYIDLVNEGDTHATDVVLVHIAAI